MCRYKTFVVVPNTITYRSNALFSEKLVSTLHLRYPFRVFPPQKWLILDWIVVVQLLLLEVELILLQYKSLNPNLLSRAWFVIHTFVVFFNACHMIDPRHNFYLTCHIPILQLHYKFYFCLTKWTENHTISYRIWINNSISQASKPILS